MTIENGKFNNIINITNNDNIDNSRRGFNDKYCTNELEYSKHEYNDELHSDNELKINIFRYKFTDEFNNELYKFSKIHQYDDRKTFKDAWNIWKDENEELINEEVRRLTLLDYDGDIMDKMFKSARYYFRKKSTEKKEPRERCKYIGMQKDLLDAMDNHIKENIKNDEYKPSNGFIQFCKENVELLKEEIIILCKNSIVDPIIIRDKMKKTYKNRYFIIIKNKK
jgi:hypothetical protein